MITISETQNRQSSVLTFFYINNKLFRLFLKMSQVFEKIFSYDKKTAKTETNLLKEKHYQGKQNGIELLIFKSIFDLFQ